MLTINRFLLIFPLLVAVSDVALGKTDPSCLKHLGGTGYDIACYDGLTKDILLDSNTTYEKIKRTIPAGNRNAKLLDEYMKSQDDSERFCALNKEAGTKWESSPTPGHYNMWDSVYAECAYEQRRIQNKRLHEILKTYNAS
jgi:hypothetical protein